MSKPTRIVVPRRDDLKVTHDFKIGDRVTLKEGNFNPGVEQKYRTGVVATLPSGPVVQLGPHVLGNEMGVDVDGGGRAVSDVGNWEKVGGHE